MEPEEYSDIEGEDPYYPETERTFVTTTRSGRSVYTPRRLVVEEYEEVSSDSEGPSSIDTQSTDATFRSSATTTTEEEESEDEEEDESEGSLSSSLSSSTPSTP
jgi:hypothetical protein